MRPREGLRGVQLGLNRSGHLPTLRPEYDHEPSEGQAPTVRVRDWTTPTSGDETAWRLERLGISVVVPPSAPGAAKAAKLANRTILVTAPPGRWLADRVSSAGLPLALYQDLSYYDFVKALRAMVYAVASVIVCVGLLAFGVTAVDRAVARRREVTSLQIIGIPRRALRGSQLFESAVPIAVGSILAIGLGLLAGATYLSMDSGSLPVPWQGPLLIGVGAVVGALLIGCLTMLASSPRISPDLIRQE